MGRLDFNAPEFNKKTQKSFEVDASSIVSKVMKKINVKVMGTLAIYLILFGLISNIWLMFTNTKVYFGTAFVAAIVIGFIVVIKRVKKSVAPPVKKKK